MKLNIDGVPKIDRAGEYLLVNPNFDFMYKTDTYSLHLYDYEGIVSRNGQRIPISSGDLTYEPLGLEYSYYSKNPGKHWCIHFRLDEFETSETFDIPEVVKLDANKPFVIEEFKMISHLVNEVDNEQSYIEACYRLKSLLLSLKRYENYVGQQKRSKSTFHWNELINLIETNLDQPLSVSWLAEKLNLSAPSLGQKFRKEYKLTLNYYILKTRIEKACSLLRNSPLTIREVGTTVGIDDPQYFNKQFRKLNGKSPSAYRDENKKVQISFNDEVCIQDGEWKE